MIRNKQLCYVCVQRSSCTKLSMTSKAAVITQWPGEKQFIIATKTWRFQHMRCDIHLSFFGK